MAPRLEDIMLEAISRYEGVERLELLDWEEIHEAIQAILQDMDEPIKAKVPGVRVQAGRNSAKAWSLFSYRVFSPAIGTDTDPVVVGINFTTDQNGIIIRGDICGETIGDVLRELPPRHVIGEGPTLEAARDLADELARNWAVVVQALNNDARHA